jgi:hypothetical protein
MTNPLKLNHLSPLQTMRDRLVGERRAAAKAGDTATVLQTQGAIDLLDRALEDERKSPH